MKRILLFVKCILFFTCAMAQEFIAPTKDFFRSKVTINFLAQYRLEADGMYHYYETDGLDFFSKEYSPYKQAIEGVEHFYCYDNNNNIFYYYTENTIGFYNPKYPQYSKFIKNYMKQGNVKKVKEADAILLTETIRKSMNEKYKQKNDSIAEVKRIQREKFVKDSIDNALKKQAEMDEYRKTHDWRHDFNMKNGYGINCQFCNISHTITNPTIVSISADTLYYLLDKPDFSYLGINHVGVHYSALTTGLKSNDNFKKFVEVWRDSIANNNSFSNQGAAIFNLIQYNEFKDKIFKAAPNGFMQRWGWELNSAQGIEPFFTFFNSSKKTIKYVDFYFSIYNAVGDRCYLRYEKSYIGNVRGVGPVESFDSGSWNWDRATHYTSADASEMRIVKLVITYMDGTIKTIPRESILYDD